jgi:hypothetical protein
MSQFSPKFDEAKRHAVYARDGYGCAYCGHTDPTKSGGGLQLDHIHAASLGGALQNTKGSPADNLVTSCATCNRAKSAMTPRVFNAYLKANGKNAIDWKAVRTQAARPIDIKVGAKNAVAARAFREAKGEPMPPQSQPATEATVKPQGPGEHHGEGGKFESGARVVRAREGETAAFNLSTVQALVRHYQALQGLADCTFAVQLVPGLSHEGKPAWATVEPIEGRADAYLVKVRDLAQTPVPGVADPWTELKVTISHELWHPWVNRLLAAPTIENEEALVEAAAQAVVRAAGPDARIMARSFQALPAAVRARAVKISARSPRARGGHMDGKAVLAAIKDQDEAGALSILESWAAEQIAAAQGQGGAPAPVDPAGPAPVDGGATDMRGAPMPPKPGAKPTEGEPPESEEDEARKAARKARQIKMDEETKALRARQVAATVEAEKTTKILRESAIRARIAEARTVDKAAINAEAEKLILASPSIDEAEIRLTLARGSAATTTQRARAIDKDGKPVEVQTVEAEGANVEGLSPMDLQTIDNLGGPRSSAGKQYAAEAQRVRARLAKGAKPEEGAAS